LRIHEGPGAVLVHPELREELDGRGLSRRHAGDRFEVTSAGCSAPAEIYLCTVRAMDEDLARLSEELYPQPLDRG
jgi:hypothetical protein